MVIDMRFSRFPFCLITFVLIFHLFLAPTLSLGQVAQRQKLSPGAEEVEREIGVESLVEKYYSLPESERSANGKMKMPRHRPTDSQQVRDAEEFELEGLISDAEDEEGTTNPKQPNRLDRSTEAV